MAGALPWTVPAPGCSLTINSPGTGVVRVLVTVVAVLAGRTTLPCTTFLTEQNGPVVGKSYDWHQAEALVVVNMRGVEKVALLLDGSTPAHWISRYGSLTFNQYGCEFPNGGMNEQGLVVEIMWLDSTVYPPWDYRPTVSELQWIQHALDNFATVAELTRAAPTLRVAPVYAKVHYLACDATGACAAFEYLVDGRLVITSNHEMTARTLTNSTYAASARYLSQFEPFGGHITELPETNSSLDRFVRASALAQGDHTGEAVPDFALSILENVAQSSYTKWHIVYQPTTGQIYFRTRDVPSLKEVNFADFDLSCSGSGTLILDMATDYSGNVAPQFEAFSTQANLALIEVTVGDIADHLPPGAMAALADYPNQVTCVLDPKCLRM